MSWLIKLLKSLSQGFANLSPSCREASRLQSHALDHPLSLTQRVGLRIHLFLCRWCRRYGKQIHFLRDAAHHHPEKLAEPANHGLPDGARERIKQKLRTEGQ